ncbi:hypothetical protein BOTBODRAFT_136250 [Botryobasidium botryosum FD-172 SS1]|uniref:Aminoglycoside phosphotransferase domain-containing protein n=1 Tax=Botryobasidium botryosum (strain FD-172 SS1) TaxID=930990 RepID=A0A067M5C3_BOTB1|nr:hypothetical protein BOTBODRAFT_136250 [Botryobasidium botryosum FD-172 SS1]
MTEKEARAMQYIRQETTIPVPRVHMSFSRDNVGYIVMDRVEGETLATASFDLTHEQLTAIATELKGYVEQIARLQPPNPTFGSWPSGPYFNNYFHEGKGAVALPSFKEFHAYWVKRLGPRSREVFPTSILDNVCTEDLDVSFMHGDLNLSNIMVKDGKIVSILDWDSLGWYPRFWEMMTIRRGYMSLEWRDVVDSVFGPYPPIVSAYSECLFYICEGM